MKIIACLELSKYINGMRSFENTTSILDSLATLAHNGIIITSISGDGVDFDPILCDAFAEYERRIM